MIDKQIAAIVPTRRPHNIAKLLECADETITRHVTWFVGIDPDDGQDYPEHRDVRYVTLPAEGRLAALTNFMAEQVWDDFPILAQFDDDQWPRTKTWDGHVMAAMAGLNDRGLVYANDGWMGERTPVCPFWPSAWAKALGWLYHPDLWHLFADNTLHELAKAAGRVRYLPHVLIEHMHPIVQKSQMDPLYERNNGGETWGHDEAVFKAYVASEEFRADVAALKEAC